MSGKKKCKILKEIRQKIAEENDIAYITSECKYQGECSGTCPRCEAEVKYLEDELRKRQNLGKRIAVAGVAALLLATTATGCEYIEDKVEEVLKEGQLQGAVAPPVEGYP